MTYFLAVIGFLFLIKGAEWLLEGAKAVASKLGISDLLIGLTIVALGTSMPEFMISFLASLSGNAGLATGNVLGSNIANILLILGICALVQDLPVRRNTILSEVPFSLAAALLVGFLANSALWYEQVDELHLSRGDGLILLFFFALFMSYVVLIGLEEKQIWPKFRRGESPISGKKSALYIFAGMICMFLGGKWIVTGATDLAQLAGLSDAFIGLTVVALGTSLPELATALTAVRQNKTDLVVGNAIGSNIFNMLWILGLSALIEPLPFATASNVDLLMVIGSSCLILLALIIGRRTKIQRSEGVLFLLTYLAYFAFLVYRG